MAYILPHLSNASILNTGLALQNSGLKTMLNSTVSGLQDLSNYYAKQEDARYKNALLNSGILNSFNVANKGTEYATVLPNQTQDGTNIYSLLNQNIQGMTNERRSKIFNDLLRQRQYNYQTESKLLQSNINQTKNKQANSLLSYLSTLQDKNNDGSIDINDLNTTERSGIMNNGALYDSVQSKLLGQAFKDKNQYLQTQSKQGYEQQVRDDAFSKQKELKDIDFMHQLLLNKNKYENELKLYGMKQSQNNRLQKLHEISYKALNTPSITTKDIKPIVDDLMSDKEFTDSLTKNNSAYKKVSDLKKFSDASKDFLNEVKRNPNLLKTGTMQTMNNMWLKLTGTSLPLAKKEEYLKAKDYQTRMKLFIMDYLQYKSGAAFGREELQGYLDSGGILDFTSPQLALKSLEGMTKYLKQKTIRDIEAVPNANQRLVLSYKAELIPRKNPIAKINQLNKQGNREALVKYLRELKEKYPISYLSVKKYYKGQ